MLKRILYTIGLIPVFLILNYSLILSNNLKYHLSLLNFENNNHLNLDNGSYNLDFKLGFGTTLFNNTKWHFVEWSKSQALKIGINYNGNSNFINFNLLNYENFHSVHDYWSYEDYQGGFISKYIDLLCINRDIVFDKQINWFKFGFGYGYDLIIKNRNFLILELPMKLGYTNLKFNDYFSDISNNLNYEGVDFELGPKIRYISENFILMAESKYRKILDKKDLNIIENGIEICYSINDWYGIGVHVESGNEMGTAMVPNFYDNLNVSLFANYNLYMSGSSSIAIPIIGVKFNVYGTAIIDRF